MDVSGSTLHLHRTGVATRHEALAARVDDLDDQRHQVAEAVEAMLRTWRGDAADEFRARWEDWRDGADRVIAALGASLATIDLACADLRSADVTSHVSSARLQGRLG